MSKFKVGEVCWLVSVEAGIRECTIAAIGRDKALAPGGPLDPEHPDYTIHVPGYPTFAGTYYWTCFECKLRKKHPPQDDKATDDAEFLDWFKTITNNDKIGDKIGANNEQTHSNGQYTPQESHSTE